MSLPDLLPWKEEYKMGVSSIDQQHRKIFDLINQLYVAIQEAKGPIEVKGVLMELVEYADTHFAFEEKYFKEFQYEGTEQHVSEHNAYRELVAAFIHDDEHKNPVVSFKVLDFLEDWWLHHINSVDRKYIDCFKEHGVA
jgi:hemerythrin-like metal-binding protein